MQRAQKSATQPSPLEMPEGWDPCGVPHVELAIARARAASSHRRQARRLPGLPPASIIASVEGVAERGDDRWLVWGCVAGGPVLFAVEAGAAAEMLGAVTAGETATAIIEPWQLMLERLD
jgi:hypothetical protein